jgi:hypothetical protein
MPLTEWYGEWNFQTRMATMQNSTPGQKFHSVSLRITKSWSSICTAAPHSGGQHISMAKGMRTLGVRLAPDGNDTDEYAYRLQHPK